jgi:hypothetical protein
MRSQVIVGLFAASLMLSSTREVSADNNCPEAAIHYFCTAAMVALGRATPDKTLSAGLLTKASSHAQQAEHLGYLRLKDKYYLRGVTMASQGRINEIISICLEPNQDTLKAFRFETRKDCR